MLSEDRLESRAAILSKDRLASESTDFEEIPFEELPLTGQKFLQAIVSNSTDTEESHGYITMTRWGVEHKLTSDERDEQEKYRFP